MQLLPQSHFHAQVVVDVEAHWVIVAVVVVVRVVLIVRGHEAVCIHLHQQRKHKSQSQNIKHILSSVISKKISAFKSSLISCFDLTLSA